MYNNKNSIVYKPGKATLLKEALNNKIPCYIINSKKGLSNIEIYLIVKVGSKNDLPMKKGLAHYLEHMLLAFDNLAEETEKIIENVWGCTNFEETVFHISCKNEAPTIKKAIKIIEQIIEGETLDSLKMEKVRRDIILEWYFQVDYENWKTFINQENEVIKQKIEGFNDQEWEILIKDNRFKQRNKMFPYMKKFFKVQEDFPVGKLEDIRCIQFNDIRLFHNQYYRPENISLLAITDLKNIDLLRLFNENLDLSKVYSGNNLSSKKIDFENTNENYLFREKNEQQQEVTIYFIERVKEKKIKCEENIFEKMCMLIFTQYVENKLLDKGYEVLDSYTETIWLMEKNKLHSMTIELKQMNDRISFENTIKQLLKFYRIKDFTLYEKRKLKRMMFEYFNQDSVNFLVNSCIGEFIYSQRISEKINCILALKDIIKTFNHYKFNRFMRELIQNSNIYIYFTMGNVDINLDKVQKFEVN